MLRRESAISGRARQWKKRARFRLPERSAHALERRQRGSRLTDGLDGRDAVVFLDSPLELLRFRVSDESFGRASETG